jgi:hypothetical protein
VKSRCHDKSVQTSGQDLSRLKQIRFVGLCLGGFCTDGDNFICQYKFVQKCAARLNITARQYGEVVLPDDSTGQGFGTLAENLSRCKEGMARVFAIMVQI